MTKEVFLNTLKEKLSWLPQDELLERILFYEEMVDDRIEDGMAEEDAVAAVGSVDQIAEQVMSEIPLTKLVTLKVKPKRKRTAGEIVLLVLGSPLWLPLLLAAAAVLFSLYIVLWSLVISLYAVDVSLAAGAVLSVPSAIHYFNTGNRKGAVCMLGAGIAMAGLSILMFFVCVAATKGVLRMTKRIILKIKSRFIRKGDADDARA